MSGMKDFELNKDLKDNYIAQGFKGVKVLFSPQKPT